MSAPDSRSAARIACVSRNLDQTPQQGTFEHWADGDVEDRLLQHQSELDAAIVQLLTAGFALFQVTQSQHGSITRQHLWFQALPAAPAESGQEPAQQRRKGAFRTY